MQKVIDLWSWLRRQPRWRLAGVAVVLGLLGLWLWQPFGEAKAGNNPSFAARRGPLEISVLEGGSLQALESQEIKCEVRVGYQGTKILKIVEEGYLVTDDDVKNGKVLVELDSSELQKQIVQQEIQYQSAVASLIDAQQNYEIQIGQNDSDIKAAEQKVRFARLDFDKFLGDTATAKIIALVGLDKMLAAASTNNVEETSLAQEAALQGAGPPGKAAREGAPAPTESARPRPVSLVSTNAVVIAAAPRGPGSDVAAPGSTRSQTMRVSLASSGSNDSNAAVQLAARPQPGEIPAASAASPAAPPDSADDEAEAKPSPSIKVDFSQYARIEALGDGEAKQKVRKFEDDLQVAQKELGQATTTLEGTRRLFDKGFLTRTDLQNHELAFENSRLKVQTADTARDLFLKYDFLKSAEESLSKYADAVREFDKARRVAISKLAQARARLKSAQGQYEVQLRQRNDYKEQLEKCTLKAKKTGLVVYGGGRDDMFYYGGEERIREGASVRERQAIITIPDLSRMSVNVKIHESYIKKVKKGQKARITVDAFPNETLTGDVTKVAVLPDSQNRWMNPDMKVYLTTITIDGTREWVKPGMSAKVEILVNKLEDCVYVPMQAVAPEGERQVCYLATGFKPERREVQVGEFNDEFIQIKSGLKEGERVLLRPPGGAETEKAGKDRKAPENNKETPAQPAAPVAAAQAKRT